jgi:hypothetical protein
MDMSSFQFSILKGASAKLQTEIRGELLKEGVGIMGLDRNLIRGINAILA